jgi:hypothetical protein
VRACVSVCVCVCKLTKMSRAYAAEVNILGLNWFTASSADKEIYFLKSAKVVSF